jgi:putative inorganic carbon (hco3(-)) transporter
MPLRSIAFILYFFGSATATFVAPMAGVLCYITLYHVYPETTWWGKYLDPFGIRWAFVIALCLVIGTAINHKRLRLGRYLVHPIEWGLLMVFCTMLLSALAGVGWDHRTSFVIDKMAKVFLFAFTMSHVVVSRRHVWHLTVLLAVMSLYLGHEARVAPPGAFSESRLNGIGGPDFREATGLAIHLLALLPFAAILLLHKAWRFRLLAFLAIAYSINAVVLCRARSAFVAGVLAGITALWYVPRRHRGWVVAMLALGAVGSYKLSDQWFWERMKTIASSPEDREVSSAARLVIWGAAWEMIKDRPLGVGVGQFERYVNRYATLQTRTAYGNKATESLNMIARDAHNSFVLCVAETGFLGLAAFVATLALSWRTLSRLDRRVRDHLSDPGFFRMIIFANRMALLVYLIAGMFVSRFYTEGFWWLIILPVCLKRAVENEIRQEVQDVATVRSCLQQWMDRGGRLPLGLATGVRSA